MQTKKVLVVDDERDICDLISFFLEKNDFAVSTAHSGSEAFEKIKDEHFDFVISDIKMPGGDGVSLLKKIQNRMPDPPPVVFVSAYAELNEVEAKDAGALGILKKPIDYDELVQLVKESLVSP